ncbi:MAG: 50S ribosomal protein L30e [Thermoprotei archaeon]|nr:MAG: 50S ribosomal protein L30e [Thermoprotei archaeon]
MIDIGRELRVAMSTGKVILGSRRTIKAILHGKAKLVIIAANCPKEIKEDILRYAKLAKVPVFTYPGSSWELGAACGKPFMVAALAVVDPGESEIMTLAGSSEVK